MKKITSLHNPFVKFLLNIKEKSKERKKYGVFLIEGKKEISLAFKGGYKIEKILFCPKICSEYEIKEWSKTIELVAVTDQIFKKLTYRSSTEGVVAIAEIKTFSLSNLKLSSNPLILIAESPEKPGNIGALLRTADAANLDAVIIANAKGDLYNPNIIRSSIGCVFTNQIAIGTTHDIITFLKRLEISIYCATLQDAKFYDSQDYTTGCAFVVGTESTGLSKEWYEAKCKNIIIPMQGEIDSINVSVAAAIIIFEAKRQRGF